MGLGLLPCRGQVKSRRDVIPLVFLYQHWGSQAFAPPKLWGRGSCSLGLHSRAMDVWIGAWGGCSWSLPQGWLWLQCLLDCLGACSWWCWKAYTSWRCYCYVDVTWLRKPEWEFKPVLPSPELPRLGVILEDHAAFISVAANLESLALMGLHSTYHDCANW